MGTVVIGANTYNIYGTQAEAVAFLGGSLASSALAYLAADPATKQRQALVQATNALDAERWQGAPVLPVDARPVPDPGTQPLQFPRTGLTRYDGSAVSSLLVPIEIERACYLIAAMLVEDPALLDSAQAGASNVKRVNAKGVEIEFFTTTTGGRFPTTVQKLLVQFLAGFGSSLSPSDGTGTTEDTASSFGDDAMYPLVRSY